MPAMFPVPFQKRNLLALLLLCWLSTPGRCQIGIDQDQPHHSSVLDINSPNKGLLIPRLPTGTREALSAGDLDDPLQAPANSLLVFDTGQNGFFYYSTPFKTWFSLLAVKPGPGWSTYTGNLELVGNVKASKFEGDGIIPPGGIIMWSGPVNTIPTGWALCNGLNGTPNLTDRFILGAGGNYNPTNTGGNATVTLTEAQLPSHTHAITGDGAHSHTVNSAYVGGAQADQGQKGKAILESQNYDETTSSDGAHNHGGAVGATGKNEAVGILPPYYALAFIMKL